MTIHCVYNATPKFPASDQHPSAIRYFRLQNDDIVTSLPNNVSPKQVIDATGAPPTAAEIDAILNPAPPSPEQHEQIALAALNGGDLQNVNMKRMIKAIILNFTARNLGIAPGSVSQAQFQTECARIAAIYRLL